MPCEYRSTVRGELAAKLFDGHPVERKVDVRARLGLVRFVCIARDCRNFVLHLAITLLETGSSTQTFQECTQSRLRNVADRNLYRKPLLSSDRLFGKVRGDP